MKVCVADGGERGYGKHDGPLRAHGVWLTTILRGVGATDRPCGRLAAEQCVRCAESLDKDNNPDNLRYQRHVLELEGNPLMHLAGQLESYSAIFNSLPENTLPEGDTIILELLAVLEIMLLFKRNTEGFNHFWGKNALLDYKAWLVVRRLARMALQEIGWPVVVPEKSFEELLYS